jgi:hypothetical protein
MKSARCEAITYTRQHKHRINADRLPCLAWDSNSTIPVFKWAKTFHALDYAATVIGVSWDQVLNTEIYNSVMSLFWLIIPFTTKQFTYWTPFPLPASSKPEVITHCFHINQVGYRWLDAVILTGVRLGCEFASVSNYKSIYILNNFLSNYVNLLDIIMFWITSNLN